MALSIDSGPVAVVTDGVADQERARTARWWRLVTPVAVVAAIGIVGALIGDDVPTWLDAHVRPWLDDVYDWTVQHNDDHWLFTRVFEPIADALTAANDAVLWTLRHLRWPGVLTVVALIGWRTGGSRAATVGVLAMAGCGVLGFWDETMVTMALMLVAVVVSLLIGIPLGILAGRNDRAERWLRGILDTAQVMPAFVYFLPVVVAFGIRVPAAVIATVVYAAPPAVRLTSHGLRSVAVVATEVGVSFGCTSRQLLAKVELPLARRVMLLGLNQVIMMAFAIVVLASMLGVAGLGGRVLSGLQRVQFGQAFAPGLAIVFAAVALDRITTGERPVRTGPGRRRAGLRLPPQLSGRPPLAVAAAAAALVTGLAALATVAGADDFPSALTVDIVGPLNDAVRWVNEHVRTGVPLVGGTGSFSDFVTLHVLNPVRGLLVDSPWWAVMAAAVAVGWLSAGSRLAALCGACFAGIAALRTWDLAMETLSQVLVIVVISVIVAVPIGIWVGRSDRTERLLRPILDAAQVMPAFVYLVPVIFLFNVGRVPGIVASVIYALPPCIRLVNLGLREVPMAPREAAISFGATPRQELVKVQLPMAARAIMLGINQTILMVLSMVVIAALIGAGGLGLETVYGLTKSEIGRGVAGGASIVLLAIVLDRITQSWGARSRRS